MRNSLLLQPNPLLRHRLLAHLEKNIPSNMTMTGDFLYDARFAGVAVGGNVPTGYARGVATAKPKARPGGRPLSNLSRAQTLPRADPLSDEEPPTDVASLSRDALKWGTSFCSTKVLSPCSAFVARNSLFAVPRSLANATTILPSRG